MRPKSFEKRIYFDYLAWGASAVPPMAIPAFEWFPRPAGMAAWPGEAWETFCERVRGPGTVGNG